MKILNYIAYNLKWIELNLDSIELNRIHIHW
jgi:hypothetical protein